MDDFLGPLALGYASFRLALALVTVLVLAVLWRRPHGGRALALVLGVNLVCWAAYRWPLQRSYGLAEGTDRAFNLGMAACTAEGVSPFEHTQRGFSSPEPFWNTLVALMAGFDVRRVPAAYETLSPLSLLAVVLGLYFALRGPPDAPADRAFEPALAAFAVLGLSSLTQSGAPPTPPFWPANFMLKPNHAMGCALVPVVAALAARPLARRGTWLLGLVLGALAWVSLLSWAYTVVGLCVGALLRPREERQLGRLALAQGLGLAIAAPFILHLMRHMSPFASEVAARHMWNDSRGLMLAVPNWSTLDLGALLSLGLVGMWVWRRRGGPLYGNLLGLALAAWGLWLVSVPATLLGVAPEPDELHYHLRFMLALAAGAALSAAALWIERGQQLAPGRGAVLALLLALPLSFASYWDPPTMDRYFVHSRPPIPPNVRDYGAWILAHTPRGSVFSGGRTATTWIPVLAGRQVLLAPRGKLLPRDYEERREAERILLTSRDPGELRRTAERFGVAYVAVDQPLVRQYGVEGLESLAAEPLWTTLYVNAAVRIVALAPTAP